MSAVRSLTAAQLIATGALALVQAVSGSPEVFENGAGKVASIVWIVLSLGAFFAAALKAYDNRQYKWLVGMAFVWPLMYPFAFKYSKPSRY